MLPVAAILLGPFYLGGYGVEQSTNLKLAECDK